MIILSVDMYSYKSGEFKYFSLHYRKNFHPSRSTLNAYVRFETVEMADAAVEANGVEFMGKHLRVNKAMQWEDHSEKHAVFVGNLPFGEYSNICCRIWLKKKELVLF